MIHAICWTLLHSLWEGVLAAVLAGVIVMATRQSPAGLRYRLLLADLFLLVTAVIGSFCFQLDKMGSVPMGQPVILVDAGVAIAPAITPVAPGSHWQWQAFFDRYAFPIVVIWLFCVTIQLFRVMGGLHGLRRIRRTGARPEEKWVTLVEELTDALGIVRPVQLLESAAVKMPSVLGHFKPVILVPLGMLANLPPAQVESILLHELAHIRRSDYGINLLLHITEAVLFFNPGLRYLSALIRREREACCDDMVLAVMDDRTAYIEALVAFKEYMHRSGSAPQLALGLAGKKNALLGRVLRMLTKENKTLDTMEKTILSVGLAAIVVAGLVSMRPVVKTTRSGEGQHLVMAETDLVPGARIVRDTMLPPSRDTLKLKKEKEAIRQKKALDEQQALMNGLPVKDTMDMRKLKLLEEQLARANDQFALSDSSTSLALEQKKMLLDQLQMIRDKQAYENDMLQPRIVPDYPTPDLRIGMILGDLKANGLITDANTVAFSLNKDGLIVNNKPAPADVFLDLKKKYLHSPKDHYNYNHHGGSTQTDIWTDND